MSCYPWHITTKYYEADIHLFDITNRDLISEEFAKSVRAIVIEFDPELVRESINSIENTDEEQIINLIVAFHTDNHLKFSY